MQLYAQLTIFLFLPVSALNTIVHNSVVLKTVAKRFCFCELKIEKVKIFTQIPTNFALASLNVGGCFANYLTFRPFLTFWHIKLNVYILTHFSPVSHSYTPRKRQKIFGFLTFSGGIGM